MERRPTKRGSLTAWLERASADRAEPPVESDPGPAVGPRAREASTVDEGGARCTASVMSGHHCPRPAVAGGQLCAGHAAMAGKPVARMPATG